jgi:hypothetical protein
MTFVAEFAWMLRSRLYSDVDGVLQHSAFLELPNRRWSLFALGPLHGRSRWILWAGLLASLGVAIGFLTKLFAVVAVVVINSTTVRYRNLVHAGLTFGSLVLFFLIFSPAGSSYSLDHLLGIARLDAGWAWGIYCAKIQVNLLYAGTALSKLMHPEWRDGTLMYRLLSHNVIRTRVPMPPWIANLAVSRASTYLVILVQLACPLALWWRGYPATVSITMLGLMHGSMSVFLRLRLFPLYVLSSLALFV